MKFTLFVLIVLLLIGCKKENGGDGLQNYLQGKWELSWKRRPNVEQSFPAGNGNLLEFSASTYFRFYQNQQTETGSYILMRDTAFNRIGTKITFLEKDTAYSRFILTSDTAIVFFEYQSNGESSLYKRLK